MLSLEFTPERDAEFFAATPAAPAVFLPRADNPQAEPYVPDHEVAELVRFVQ